MIAGIGNKNLAVMIDTYANTTISGTSSTDWTLYYSTDGGTSWTSLGTSTGAASSGGVSSPLGISWDLSSIGIVTTPVDFILDPVSTGGTNGSVDQRGQFTEPLSDRRVVQPCGRSSGRCHRAGAAGQSLVFHSPLIRSDGY